MPRNLTPEECENFLAEPQVGVLSVTSDNERPPLSVPVWYAYQLGGELTFFTGTQGRTARKTRLLDRAGNLTFCVQKPDYPYKYVTIECSIVDVEAKPAAEKIVAIASRYLPEDMAQGFAQAELANPAGTFRLYTVRPDRWSSFDFSDV